MVHHGCQRWLSDENDAFQGLRMENDVFVVAGDGFS